ncbi:hypothetical protein F8388_014006 [Cannabis sativa]|uniref:GDSL esterase/lipase n=1 Tax=Cannabis sativa TaxID=3483 RepID=A0A7J6FHC7_CANSA|nr:hypothetical protein G4B88_028322 [Cannabis sativa]KAF4383506.1 hypothetical protein F8388_014006 [Cannabis sativa]
MNMKMKFWTTVIVVVVMLFGFGASVKCGNNGKCKKKAVIFNFGDSNSDTGGFSIGFGIIFGPPSGRTFFHRPTGRLCDGRVMIDFLLNFAVSGASTKPERQPFNLDVQIRQFQLFRARSLDLISQGYKDLVKEEEFKKALYIIDIGQNDLASSFTFNNLTYAQVVDNIPSFITVIQTSVRVSIN